MKPTFSRLTTRCWMRIALALGTFLLLPPFIRAAPVLAVSSPQGEVRRGDVRPSRRPSFRVTMFRAMRWLASAQSANGSWDEDGEVTALVLGTMISSRNGDVVFEEEFMPVVSNAVAWSLQRHEEGSAEDFESGRAKLDLALWMVSKRWPDGPFEDAIAAQLHSRHEDSWPDDSQLMDFAESRTPPPLPLPKRNDFVKRMVFPLLRASRFPPVSAMSRTRNGDSSFFPLFQRVRC